MCVDTWQNTSAGKNTVAAIVLCWCLAMRQLFMATLGISVKVSTRCYLFLIICSFSLLAISVHPRTTCLVHLKLSLIRCNLYFSDDNCLLGVGSHWNSGLWPYEENENIANWSKRIVLSVCYTSIHLVISIIANGITGQRWCHIVLIYYVLKFYMVSLPLFLTTKCC